VLFDRECDGALEARRRQNATRVAGVRKPSHDRAEALRHTRSRVADAVVIHQEKPHELSVQTEERCVNNTKPESLKEGTDV
jgi:hypothetical protein